MKNLAKNIYLRRKELGMTQKEIADVIGTSRALICKYEKSYISSFPLSTLHDIASALKTHPINLLGWNELIDSPFIRELVDCNLSDTQAAEVLRYAHYIKNCHSK